MCGGDLWRGTAAASRALWGFLWGTFSLLIVAAPWLETHGQPAIAIVIRLLFSPLCHQNPERCFVLAGSAWAVCHRCSGIYVGFLAALLLPAQLIPRSASRRALAAVALVPMLLDALLPLLGLWTNTAGTRFISGFVFASILSSLLLPGFSELHQAVFRKRSPARSLRHQGDIP